ncbi:unnamed protein product [Nesidiocoris tenuis]|uniref:Kelch domain-containing protein 10 n=1 Tax=Nesidiocoris tenuis TaxID=355587 RepID=A0A6H5GE18_9HEMI|nr:unnamed protein product [Nesidiocoris tenuis]
MGNSQMGLSDVDLSTLKIETDTMMSTTTYAFRPFVFEKYYPAKSGNGGKPKPRSGHRAVCNDQNLYSYGGYNPNIKTSAFAPVDVHWLESKPLFRELWKFNFASKTWTKLEAANVPLVLASNAVLLEGRVLFVYGGTGVPFGGHCSNALYVCNLNESPPTFREVPVTGSLPEPQYGQAAFIDGPHLYVIGGTTGYEYSADVHKLDLAAARWSDSCLCKGLPNEPMGRYRHELGIHGSKVFMFGGGTSDESFGFKDIPVFDFEKDEWSSVSTQGDENAPVDVYPKSRRFHSCVKIPDSPELVIIGGFNGCEILDDCWLFNLESLKWKKLFSLKLPFPTYFHASCITPAGKLYNFGGICEAGQRTHRTADILTAWVCIPKLKEICWEAVLHYDFLNKPNGAEVLACLPIEFRSRLQSNETDLKKNVT